MDARTISLVRAWIVGHWAMQPTFQKWVFRIIKSDAKKADGHTYGQTVLEYLFRSDPLYDILCSEIRIFITATVFQESKEYGEPEWLAKENASWVTRFLKAFVSHSLKGACIEKDCGSYGESMDQDSQESEDAFGEYESEESIYDPNEDEDEDEDEE